MSNTPELTNALAGSYRLERELGQGGMAVVYLATDLKHDRRVALKVMRSEMKGILGPRFAREIKLAARLQHPHICSVHDSGETSEGELWYTMPFVEGESLRDRLTGEPRLPIPTAVRIARDAAQGLEYAHKHGTIHRDIKPENILLTEDGKTLVADFGIAKAFDTGASGGPGAGGPGAGGPGAGGPGGPPNTTVLTEAGVAIGTPAYMPPEQRLGEAVTAASDVYSLGAVLYEMLAGERAAPASSMQSLLAQMSEPAPRVKLKRNEVSSALDKVIQKALHPDPAKRYPSMAAFDAALEGAISGQFVAVSSTPVWRRPAVIGVVVLAIVAAGLGWYRSHAAGRTETVALLPFTFPSLSPSDSTPVYLANALDKDLRTIIGHLPGTNASTESAVQAVAGGRLSSVEVAERMGASVVIQPSITWQDSVAVLAFAISRPAKQQSRQVEFRGTPQWIVTHRDSLVRVLLASAGRNVDAEQAGTLVRWGLGTTSGPAYLRMGKLIKEKLPDQDWFEPGYARLDTILQLDPRFVDALGMQVGWIKQVMDIPDWLSPERADSLRREAASLTQRAIQVDPTHPMTLWARSTHALLLKDTANAVGALTEAARVQPEPRFLAVLCEIELNQVRRSQPMPGSCVDWTGIDSLNDRNLQLVVDVLLATGRSDEALEPAQRLMRLAPNDPMRRLRLIDVLQALGREEEAQVQLRAALSTAPDNTLLLWTMVESQWTLGLGEEALATSRRMVALEPNAIQSWIQLSLMLSRLKRHDEAISVARETVARFPKTTASHWRLGTVLWDAGRFDEALAEFRRCVTLASGGSDDLVTLAARLRLAGQLGEGQRAVDDLKARTANSSLALQYEGALLMWSGAGVSAVSVTRRAMGTDTLNGGRWAMLGQAELYAGQLDSAGVHLRRAMALDSFDVDLRSAFGEVLLAEGKFREAAQQGDWLRRRKPYDHQYMARQIVMHWRAGDTTEARAILDTLTQRVARYSQSEVWMAMALGAVGEMDRARAALRRSVMARETAWYSIYLQDPALIPLRETPEYAEAVRAFRQAGDVAPSAARGAGSR